MQGTGTLTPAGSCPPARPPPVAPGTARWAGCTATASARSNHPITAGMCQTPSGVPPSHHHHPKTPSVTPNQETHSQRWQEPQENTPPPQNQSPSRSIVCQVRAAVLEHRNMGPPRPPWGWSQENVVLRIPVPLTVGITSSGGAGRELRLLPPATRRGDAGRVSHGSLRWRPARRWAGKRTPRRVTVPPAPVPAGSGLRISIRQNQVSPEGPLVGGYTTGDDPLFQSAP